MLTAYTDGACLGNPGPMGIGIVIYRDGVLVEELSEYIGKGTNNIAEYTAVVKALETAHRMGEMSVRIKSDSQLIIRQLNGEYKTRDLELRDLRKRIDALCHGIEVHFEHIPREHNKEADALSKEAAERGKKTERKDV